MNVEDAMTRNVITCASEQSLADAAKNMWEQDLGTLPVVDERGAPIGMITDRDLSMAAYTQGKDLHALDVRSAMSKDVITCHAQDRLSAAERTMRVHQLRRLPVVNDWGRLVGILSLTDLARAAGRGQEVAPLLDVTETLAIISQARTPAGSDLDTTLGRWNPFDLYDTPTLPDSSRVPLATRIRPPRLTEARASIRY
jgi:CBS domain-containing protein